MAGKDAPASTNTRAIARPRALDTSHNDRGTVGSGVFYAVRPEARRFVCSAKERIFNNILRDVPYAHLTVAKHIHKRQTHLLVREDVR
jgi:hypothetical protein